MTNIDDEWQQYLQSMSSGNIKRPQINEPAATVDDACSQQDIDQIPKCDDLYISTKTKVLYLNQAVDIHTIFWEIPIIPYWTPSDGIVKKQMKIVSKTPEEFETYKTKLVGIPFFTENIIKQIDNPTARRIKYKDERKITIGISKKDIMNCRGKVKNAFYNCFALVFRLKFEGVFREIHVKIFNTGKMEIPGVANKHILDKVMKMIMSLLRPHFSDKPIEFVETNTEQNVLINSNFNCGFYINREKLHCILRSKYGVETAYDPCSYPGVKCKFYFNHERGYSLDEQSGKVAEEDIGMKMSELIDSKKYTEISLMIFRTGSCLIVGNCTERILMVAFEFIKNLLASEHKNINVPNTVTAVKIKKTKLRKKTISMSSAYCLANNME